MLFSVLGTLWQDKSTSWTNVLVNKRIADYISSEEKNRIKCDLKLEATLLVCHRFLDKLTFGWDPSKELAAAWGLWKEHSKEKAQQLESPWRVWGIAGAQYGWRIVDEHKIGFLLPWWFGKRRQSQTIGHAKDLYIKNTYSENHWRGSGWFSKYLENIPQIAIGGRGCQEGKNRSRKRGHRRGSSLKPREERVCRGGGVQSCQVLLTGPVR